MFGLIGNFGPGKLPQLGESVGKALNSFRKAREEDDEKAIED
jgi:TatA/E family protein of Tat protein translocase